MGPIPEDQALIWKLNSSLLGETHYINKIKSSIVETVNKYAKDATVDEVLLWKMIKLQIRDTSIQYSKAKTKNRVNEIDSEKAALERQLKSYTNRTNNNKETAEQVLVKKMEFENIVKYKTKEAIIGSKARWHNEGEKKRNFSA